MKPKIYIHVSGGMVQNVYVSESVKAAFEGVDIECEVLDWDTEADWDGEHPDETIEQAQSRLEDECPFHVW